MSSTKSSTSRRRIAQIREFWNWFRSHRDDLDGFSDPSAPFADVILGQLQRIDKRLYFETSRPDGGVREFIVTAQGVVRLFPLVELIVKRAPRIRGWKFIATKPPMGFTFVTNYEGRRYDPKTMWFLPLDSALRPTALGLRVGIPRLKPSQTRQALLAVHVILDTALGERAAARDIQHVEVIALPRSPESAEYIELPELAAFIEWRKRRKRKG